MALDIGSFGINIAFFIAAFSSLFTIINPFSAATIFISITRFDSRKKKIAMARKASLTAAIVLVVFALAGNYILNFFGITVDAFRIAGGIIIGSIGLSMINAKRDHLRTEKEKNEAVTKEDVSIIPMAIPILSGPGAMTTSLVLMREVNSVFDVATLIFAIIIVCLLSYFILSRADYIGKYLGETGKHVTERIMGLIVLIVGVQFVINGIEGLLQAWRLFL